MIPASATNSMAAPKKKSAAEAPSVVVIIVNYCTAKLTLDCLQSLAAVELESWPGLRVVVADNASPDGSGVLIANGIAANGYGHWANVMMLTRNGGFAYANNAVVRAFLEGAVTPQFFWLLNSDTIVRAGALTALVEFLQQNPKCGICGSRLEDPDGTQQHSAFRFPSVLSELEASARLGLLSRLFAPWRLIYPRTQGNARADWLAGASLLVRTDVFREVGLMDEAYFLYFEETDFCLAALKKSWQSHFVGSSRVVHLVGQSSGIVEGRPRRLPQYWFNSRRRYFLKNHGRLYACAADIALALGTVIAHLRDALVRRPTSIPQSFLSDLARNSVVANLWSTRRDVDEIKNVRRGG